MKWILKVAIAHIQVWIVISNKLKASVDLWILVKLGANKNWKSQDLWALKAPYTNFEQWKTEVSSTKKFTSAAKQSVLQDTNLSVQIWF